MSLIIASKIQFYAGNFTTGECLLNSVARTGFPFIQHQMQMQIAKTKLVYKMPFIAYAEIILEFW